MIRFILSMGTVVVFLIITLPALGILWIVRKFSPMTSQKIGQFMVKYAFKVVMFWTGTRTRRIGLENIPKDTPVMFACNHKSLLDACIMYDTLSVPAGFVAKKELRKAPIFNRWMLLLNCFFLDREDIRSGVKMILHSIDCINNGVSIIIAPEGTRSKTGEMNPFKEGSFKIATRTNCPIIPVAISGTDDLFENHKPFVRKAVTVVQFGEPIYLDKLTSEELKTVGAYTQKKVAEMLLGHEEYIKTNPSRRNA